MKKHIAKPATAAQIRKALGITKEDQRMVRNIMKPFNRKPTQAEMRELWDTVTEWIALYQPSCAESICQSDKVQEGLYELGESVCEVVGYYPYEDEET